MRRRRRAGTAAEDLGPLVPIATTATEDAARYIQNMLHTNAIRATTTGARRLDRHHRVRVLVVPEDATRAYDEICAHTT